MRRELQTEQMRRRILDSALEVFGAEGYDGASMNAICTRAGISKGIIYHYSCGQGGSVPQLLPGEHPEDGGLSPGASGIRGDAPAAGRGIPGTAPPLFRGVSPV